MGRRTLTAAGIVGALILCVGGTAAADEFNPPPAIADGFYDGPRSAETALEAGHMFELGPWSLGPVASIKRTGDAPFGDAQPWTSRFPDTMVGSLGVRGAAKLDSRLGAIYSRFSLSFEHALHTRADQTVTGLSGGGRNGYYASRSEIDVMTLDAAFAVQLAKNVTGFVDYGAEIDPGSGAEHAAVLRLKFSF